MYPYYRQIKKRTNRERRYITITIIRNYTSPLLLNCRRLQQTLRATTATIHGDKRMCLKTWNMWQWQMRRYEGRLRMRVLSWIYEEEWSLRGHWRVSIRILSRWYLPKLWRKFYLSMSTGIHYLRGWQILHGLVFFLEEMRGSLKDLKRRHLIYIDSLRRSRWMSRYWNVQ